MGRRWDMAKAVVRCDLCGKEFEKEVRAINEARRGGYRTFCSKECHHNAKSKTEKRQCDTCGVEIEVQRNAIVGSKTGRFYCSGSCAAKTNNLGRVRTDESRGKTSKALFGKRRNGEGDSWATANCLVCGKKFKYLTSRDRIMCSVKCSQLYQFGVLPYSKEEVVEMVGSLIVQFGQAPSSKLVERKLFSAAVRFFGSWNKLIRELGCKPNSQWVRFKPTCRDGHKADSISEMLVDNWLFERGIRHERRKAYPEGRYTCDFYLPDMDLWVEYFGIDNRHWYQETMRVKEDMAKRHGLKLIGILPVHLYPEVKLGEMLGITDQVAGMV